MCGKKYQKSVFMLIFSLFHTCACVVEKVNVNVSDLNLSVKLNIKVKQEVAIKVPLKAIVSYENAEIK